MTDFKELFMYCEKCKAITRWAFIRMAEGVDGTCEDCEYEQSFESWDEVIAEAEDDG